MAHLMLYNFGKNLYKILKNSLNFLCYDRNNNIQYWCFRYIIIYIYHLLCGEKVRKNQYEQNAGALSSGFHGYEFQIN